MADIKLNTNLQNKLEPPNSATGPKDNPASATAAVRIESNTAVNTNAVVGERDFTANLRQYQLNASFSQMQNISFQLPMYPPDAATGAEAAAILKNDADFMAAGQRDQFFAATVYKHQGDGAFMEEFFRELGPELSAELVANTSNLEQGTLFDYQNGTEQTFNAQQTVAEGLDLAAAQLPDSWNSAFIAAGTATGDQAIATAQILSKLPAGGGSNLQEDFLNAVMTPERALGDAAGNGQISAYSYARAAGEVMGANSDLARRFLGANSPLTDEERGRFIENGARFGTRLGRGLSDSMSNNYSWSGFDTALTTLPPADLQDILEKNAGPMKTYIEQLSSDSYLKDDPALGNLLQTAARIADAGGNSTPEALQLFFDAIPGIADNPAAKAGAGTFFVEHTKQIVDLATGYGGPNSDATMINNLKTFFAEAYFAPDAQGLKYRDAAGTEQPLTEAIKTALNDVRGLILEQAKDAAASGDPNTIDRETRYAGYELASLTGIVADGLIQAAQTYKTEFENNNSFGLGIADLALDALGHGAEKAGAPSFITDRVKDLLLDLVTNKANEGREAQAEAYQEIYDNMRVSIESEVADYARVNGLSGLLADAYKTGMIDYQTSFSNKARLE